MFLPVLLVRDFGFAGWLVFAVPNVLGAAAMGWILRSPSSSRSIVQNHAHACIAFSTVTVLFHIFFLEWMVSRLVGQNILLAYILAYVGFLLARRTLGARLLATVVFVVSATVFVLLVARRSHPFVLPLVRTGAGLVWLAPVCIFGFALSPYLDLTFHRARQATSRVEARFAFSIGFGAFFLAMIIFSLWYAPRLEHWIDWNGRLPMGLFAAAIGTHMLVQSAFTIAVHLASLTALREGPLRPPNLAIWSIALLALLLIVAATFINHLDAAGIRTYHGVEWGEVIYRIFMGFYGLLFPAYVWLCMLPFRRRRPTSVSLRIFAIAVVATLPMFWMGFIEGQMVWLGPGVAIVLMARFLIRTPADAAGSEPGSASTRTSSIM